jgi:hypothetical protein
MNLRTYYVSALIAACCVATISSANATIVFTVENPGVQASTVPGVITETFDEYGTGNYFQPLTGPIGTYSTGGNIQSANLYGGAGGVGNYIAIGSQSGQQDVLLTLNSNDSYFGMEYGAGDYGNQLSFYNGNYLVGTLNTQAVLAALGTNPAYFGNPTTGQDSGEPFAYFNFFGTAGTTFNKILFHNTTLGTGFETDNHSILVAPVGPHGNPIPGGFTAVPEPTTPIVFVFGALMLGGVLINRRKSAQTA